MERNDRYWYLPINKTLVKTIVALSIPVIMWAGIKHYKRKGFEEGKEIIKLVNSSPRREYVVKEGDTICSLMEENFPIEKGDFPEAERVSLGFEYWTASNEYREIVRKQLGKSHFCGNPLEVGKTIRIPSRNIKSEK